MKRFLKSAFGLNLMLILFFVMNGIYFFINKQTEPLMFCAVVVFVFGMLLPLCSTKR